MRSLVITSLAVSFAWYIYTASIHQSLIKHHPALEDELGFELAKIVNWPQQQILHNAESKKINECLDIIKNANPAESETIESMLFRWKYVDRDEYEYLLLKDEIDTYIYSNGACMGSGTSSPDIFLTPYISSLVTAVLIFIFYVITLGISKKKYSEAEPRNLKNKIRVRNVIKHIMFHLIFAWFTLGISILTLVFFAPVTYAFYRSDRARLKKQNIEFDKINPFDSFGFLVAELDHVYSYEKDLSEEIVDTLSSKFKEKKLDVIFRSVDITDISKSLRVPETKRFLVSSVLETSRGTKEGLIINQDIIGINQSFSWRIVADGYADRNKLFSMLSYSFLSFYIRIIPYIRGHFSYAKIPLEINVDFYSRMQSSTFVRVLNNTVFEALIEVFDRYGIDTGDLVAQRQQAININVSGGKVKLGNIIQGSLNQIKKGK